MNSPWGQVQHSEKFDVGISSVSTAGHGGIRVSKRYAERHLSVAARRRAEFYAGYYWFEEDCDWAIPAFELPHLWDKFFQYGGPKTPEGRRQSLIDTLIFWNVRYAVEAGIANDGARFNCWNHREAGILVKNGNTWVCQTCGDVIDLSLY
jgi:hypothetical protein